MHLARVAAPLLLLSALAGCAMIPSARDAGVRFETRASDWPAGAACLNAPGRAGTVKEVLLGRERLVVIGTGPGAISDEAWATYSPGFANHKNSDRHTLFATSCFVRSPDAPGSCTGEACAQRVRVDGYTWTALSRIEAVDCIPAGGGCNPAALAPGRLAVVVTRKCHEMTFTGSAIFLRGPSGERAIMHATADGNPTLDVALPEGWTLSREQLKAPLVLRPFGGGQSCYYNILRDSRSQSYHQFEFAGPTWP